MASQVVYACSSQPNFKGECLTGYISFAVDPDLATALNNHATALQNNTDAMQSFFSLNAVDVGLISAFMLSIFLTGNWVGKVIGLMRKS